jgi:hypothetical protein
LIQQIAVEGKEKLIHQHENHAGKKKITRAGDWNSDVVVLYVAAPARGIGLGAMKFQLGLQGWAPL